jgi:(2R)-3-sulfolactate dehydrogenase (NADP+)
VIAVDAATGFAHPAIDLGFEALIPTACELGVAALAVRNSYNCGVLGYHTHRLAKVGLLAIGFTNAPASIAPVGGHRPVVGTNPFSLAAPDDEGGAAVLIDQSASVIAKSEIMKRAREGLPIPPEWALDPDGRPTTDPEIALKGSMAPSGGYKGVGVALMVEIMAAAMTGATLGVNASPFSGTTGGPPKTGQFFLAIDPGATSGGLFAERLSALVAEIRDQPGARVPGDGRKAARRRAERKGVTVNPATLEKVRGWL